MTPLALRYDTRRGRFGRVLSGDTDRGRDAASPDPITAMDLSREIKMQELRERIADDAYRVDPQAIAGAIVERLLAGRQLAEPQDEPER